jgi:hypothetical protein
MMIRSRGRADRGNTLGTVSRAAPLHEQQRAQANTLPILLTLNAKRGLKID